MADTTTKGFPYPEGPDAVDVAGDIQLLAEAVDDMPGIQSYTQTQINALAVGAKWAGRVVWNSTTGKLQVSNGSTFSDVDTTTALASTNPAALGAAAPGTGVTVARDDHVHPTTGLVVASLIDAAGDLIVGSADNTVARVALGSSDAVLTVNTSGSGAAKVRWANPPLSPFLLMGA